MAEDRPWKTPQRPVGSAPSTVAHSLVPPAHIDLPDEADELPRVRDVRRWHDATAVESLYLKRRVQQLKLEEERSLRRLAEVKKKTSEILERRRQKERAAAELMQKREQQEKEQEKEKSLVQLLRQSSRKARLASQLKVRLEGKDRTLSTRQLHDATKEYVSQQRSLETRSNARLRNAIRNAEKQMLIRRQQTLQNKQKKRQQERKADIEKLLEERETLIAGSANDLTEEALCSA